MGGHLLRHQSAKIAKLKHLATGVSHPPIFAVSLCNICANPVLACNAESCYQGGIWYWKEIHGRLEKSARHNSMQLLERTRQVLLWLSSSLYKNEHGVKDC